MYNLMIISHGNMAEGISHTSEMILGKQTNFQYLCLDQGESKETFEKRLEEKLNNFGEGEVLVLADLYGGTPFNSTITQILKGKQNLNVIAGVNLAMVIQALMNQDRDLKEVIDEIKEVAIQGIQNGNEALSQCGDE